MLGLIFSVSFNHTLHLNQGSFREPTFNILFIIVVVRGDTYLCLCNTNLSWSKSAKARAVLEFTGLFFLAFKAIQCGLMMA